MKPFGSRYNRIKFMPITFYTLNRISIKFLIIHLPSFFSRKYFLTLNLRLEFTYRKNPFSQTFSTLTNLFQVLILATLSRIIPSYQSTISSYMGHTYLRTGYIRIINNNKLRKLFTTKIYI